MFCDSKRRHTSQKAKPLENTWYSLSFQRINCIQREIQALQNIEAYEIVTSPQTDVDKIIHVH